MDRCPPEVLHQIFQQLAFRDAASLRRVSSKYAAVGIEHLVTRVRFHLSESSILRLKRFQEHTEVSKHIESIVFEDLEIAEVGCEHSYAAHFELEHHANERPESPDEECTSRERRLYERNITKFNRKVHDGYQRYRSLHKIQQSLLESELYTTVMANMAVFPNLHSIEIQNSGRCRHVLSERYFDQFGADCAVPLVCSPSGTRDRLKMMLRAVDATALCSSLRTLKVTNVQPDFFKKLAPNISHLFQNLKSVDLTFRTEGLDDFSDICAAHLKHLTGNLHAALSSARNLEYLGIHFSALGQNDAFFPLAEILGTDTTWPALSHVNFDYITTKSDNLIATLKRNPQLKKFYFANTNLTEGTWAAVARTARKELSLSAFFANGVLEDSDQSYPMWYIDVDMFLDNQGIPPFTWAMTLEMYVTDKDYGQMDNTDLDLNPMETDTGYSFADEEDVMEEFGERSPTESESEASESSHMGCD